MSKPPPVEPMKPRTVTLPQSMWDQVRAYRLAEQIGSEMETLRQLIRAGLAAKRSRKPDVGSEGT